jgi:hypothetical protein
MTWRIPPVGWCAVCLVARQKETAALTHFRGTALCEEHLAMVFENDIEMAVMDARNQQDEDPERDEVEKTWVGDDEAVRGATSICWHCGEPIIYAVIVADEWSHQRHGDTWCHDAQNFTRTPLQRAEPDPEAPIVAPDRKGE